MGQSGRLGSEITKFCRQTWRGWEVGWGGRLAAANRAGASHTRLWCQQAKAALEQLAADHPFSHSPVVPNHLILAVACHVIESVAGGGSRRCEIDQRVG